MLIILPEEKNEIGNRTFRLSLIAYLSELRDKQESSLFDNILYQYLITQPRLSPTRAWELTNCDFIQKRKGSRGVYPSNFEEMKNSLDGIRYYDGPSSREP